jgi:hypothetical protein
MAGRGAAPTGLDYAPKHSGRIGAPPGTTTGPCQELTDDLASRASAVRPIESGARCRAKTPQMSMRSTGAVRGAFF